MFTPPHRVVEPGSHSLRAPVGLPGSGRSHPFGGHSGGLPGTIERGAMRLTPPRGFPCRGHSGIPSGCLKKWWATSEFFHLKMSSRAPSIIL